ncbi:hypothetical protein SUGI_0343970 [Cryptomeria japonica]|uniref:protein ROS1A n=1 Tax=Cryptomeria japonica TaxID=3369 RepID=UPI002408B0AD|nr:protein ROS1A [Cryptomeria japonica]GLJ19156.1 hypothetical protein SUGI_0343970 [Cryptomeria japonica]
MFESLNVCTRSMSRRGRGRSKGGWSPERRKRERKYTTKETNVQTEQVEVTKLPSLCTWAVKKKRATSCPSCSAQFVKSVYPSPSTIAVAYPQLLTYVEPYSFPCQTGVQNSDKDSAILYTDEIEGPNTPPQPIMKKRKVDFLVAPVYIIPIAESYSKVIFPQPSFVGNCDSSEFKIQGSEIVCDSENVNGNQHLLVNVSSNTELFEPNGEWRKALTNLIGESVDSALTKNDAILDISTRASDVDICHRKMSQSLSCVGISQASALPVEKTEMICCYEKITGDRHPVVNVLPEAQLFESNDDCHKTSGNLTNENVEHASTNEGPASINEDVLHISNSSSITSHRKAGSKNLATITDSLTTSAWQNNIQNQLLAGNFVPNFCMHESAGHSKEKQANLLTSDLSSTSASPTLGDNNAVQDQTLHLQFRSGLIAAEQEHGHEIDSNRVPTQKPKKKKHRPEILKNASFVKKSRSKIKANSTISKLPKGKNSKEKQTNLLTPELSSTASSPTLGDNDAFKDQTLHLQSRSGLLADEQEHGHEIDLNKVPTQKPKKRKHRPKILKDVSFFKKSRSKIQVSSTSSKLPKGMNFRGNQCQEKIPTFNKEALKNSNELVSFDSMTNVNSTTNGEMLGSSEVLRFQSDRCQSRVFVQNKNNDKELISRVAYEQAKLMLGTFGNHVKSIDEGFSKNFSSAISQKKRKTNLKVLARKKKKSKIKDLARKKFTISEKHIENEENASALTMQIVSMNPLVKFKGKRSPRKKLVVSSQNAENNSCPINPTVLCKNRSAMTVDTVHNHWQGIRVGFQSQIIADSKNNEHALCADIICLSKKNSHEQGRKMVSEHIIRDCQSSDKFLDTLDAIQERLKNLKFDEDQVYTTQLHNRKEMIPLERKDDLIPSAECLALIPYEDSLETLKTKKFRPKVLLNSETKIDFNLLTGKEGVENEIYDDEKEKLNQERNIFKNRAESFIACMRVLQGNRQFSPWKGSVVDSVVGAFLTQNVSDHLSSSAFISLASRFPRVENTKFHEERTPSDLGLSIELPQNSRSTLLDKGCESTILRTHTAVPDVSVASIENLQAENETRNVKFHREMTSDEVGFNIELPQTPTCRLPDKVCETNLLQRHDTTPELCEKYVQDDTIDNGMGNTIFQGEIAQEDLGLDGKPQVLPDIWQSDETSKLDDGWRSVPVEMTNERLMHTHSEHDHDHSLAREEPSHKKKISYHSLDLALPYTFHQRSCQARKQAHVVSDCQCSSIASDAPVHDVFDSKVPKHPRSNRRPGSTNDPISRANHIKNLISRTFYIRDSISKTSGITRAAMEMSQRNGKKKLDWESIKKNAKELNDCAVKKERCPNSNDSVNWDAVRCADLEDIADAIKDRGMNNVLAGRIKSFLEMLHTEHGSIDLEWLKDLSPNDAKNFLLNVRGIGIKSVECIRLLTLQQLAFPVDTNVARIVVRLGWVPLAPLPESLLIHKLEEYPYLNSIHQYLWPRLCTLDQRTLYELHYQLITFGKVFCQKSRPNCNACPMKLNCKHFASAFASARKALPAPVDKSLSMPISSFDPQSQQDSYPLIPLALPPISSFDILSQQNPYTLDLANISVRHLSTSMPTCEPIIEEPSSPERESIDSSAESAPHDSFDMDSEEILSINLNCNDNALQIYKSSESGTQHLDATDTSTALVVALPEYASIPLPKLKNISRLRTEHQVYEIPDNHQLLSEFDPREPDDPCSYLLAIWSQDEKVERVITPDSCCTLNGSHEHQCEQESCSSCTTTRGINDDIVKGTVLIPCKTAMRGHFPLNGTYFQVNEVFADHRTSLHPIEVPRHWIWNLRRCTVYFSTSIPSIFRGLDAEAIQECFWKGYVCVRGFERKTRAPRPLVVRLHFPASRKDKDQDNDVKYKKEG